jgi:hypothetical protein
MLRCVATLINPEISKERIAFVLECGRFLEKEPDINNKSKWSSSFGHPHRTVVFKLFLITDITDIHFQMFFGVFEQMIAFFLSIIAVEI